MSIYPSRIRKGREEVEAPEINLTPMIDVVFTILIMFIVIAPMLEVDNVALASREAAPAESLKAASPIVIHVHADNTISMNKQTMPIGVVAERIKRLRQLYPQAHLQLFHDKKGSFGTYQSIKNAAEAAGFDDMEVILSP